MKKHQKACFFQKISIIKLSAKTHLSPNFNTMGGTNKALAVATLSTLMATTSPVNAESQNNFTQEQIICETKEICQKLSQTIQTQITNLKNKGLEVLTDAEFDQYEELQKHLIAVEKSETAKNNELIDDKLKIQNEKLDRLEGILLSK
jgi:hypothetical protein